MTLAKPAIRRCAVYTRKSSEDGLEQDFNSLHAQREACEAFIRSQAGEGWKLVKDAYDDGGLSGGTIARPALQRLMADIKASKIDTVVVYKVDRLTRSLSDFAKIVELFDAHGVTFVAVTQQFNTTSSMGRLTLNILLSFAQFEREVTGERIRDKIAASKKKGMWMGGRLSLGYDVKDRKLIISETEAQTVKHIFERYLNLGSVRLLQMELAGQGIKSKRWLLPNGTIIGGVEMGRGALYKMLANPIYIGEVRHKEARYPGQHHAIIELPLWEAVQRQLKSNAVERCEHRTKTGSGLLTGKIFDDRGRRLTPTYAKKGNRQYRYYSTPPSIAKQKPIETNGNAPLRVPAPALEQIISQGVATMLGDQHRLMAVLNETALSADQLPAMLQSAAYIHRQLQNFEGRSEQLAALLKRIDIGKDHLRVTIELPSLPDGDSNPQWRSDRNQPVTITWSIPVQFHRRQGELRMVIVDPSAQTRNGSIDSSGVASDQALLKAIARARRWFVELKADNAISMEEIAKREAVTPRYVARLLPLAFLAPDIVEAIASGRQPVELSISSIRDGTVIPISWTHQRRLIGIKP